MIFKTTQLRIPAISVITLTANIKAFQTIDISVTNKILIHPRLTRDSSHLLLRIMGRSITLLERHPLRANNLRHSSMPDLCKIYAGTVPMTITTLVDSPQHHHQMLLPNMLSSCKKLVISY